MGPGSQAVRSLLCEKLGDAYYADYYGDKQVRRIRELFDSRLVYAFDCTIPLCVEAAGTCILIYRHRRVVAVDRLKDFINTAEQLCDALVTRATELGRTQPSVGEASLLLADSK